MNYKSFSEEQPAKDGDYWYLVTRVSKPAIRKWVNRELSFVNFMENVEPDPEFWCEIKEPTFKEAFSPLGSLKAGDTLVISGNKMTVE